MRIPTSSAISRAGFTLVELLVVIAIIGTLIALLLPAVNAARATARSAQCMNSLKQVGTGMINYSTQKQRFPGYVQPVRRSNGEFLLIDTAGGIANSDFESSGGTDRTVSWVSWAGVIAPQLERQDIYDAMVDGTVNHGDPRAAIRPIEILICPADTDLTASPANAGLSYSANAGGWDFNAAGVYLSAASDPNTGDTKDNGMCHNLSLSKVQASDARDGASTTILLAENVHKEIEPSPGNPGYTWMGVQNNQFAEQQFGIVWVVHLQPINGTTILNTQQAFSAEGNTAGFPIDSPAYARPASAHPSGAFNTFFVDGHTQAIAADIDYDVYQRLMTPNGRECVDPADHTANLNLGEPIFDFRNLAPLSESDY